MKLMYTAIVLLSIVFVLWYVDPLDKINNTNQIKINGTTAITEEPATIVSTVTSIEIIPENEEQNLDNLLNYQIAVDSYEERGCGDELPFNGKFGTAYTYDENGESKQVCFWTSLFSPEDHQCFRVGEYQLLTCIDMVDKDNDGLIDDDEYR